MSKKITLQQLEGVAHQLGCEPAVLDAVFKVESNGSGFDKKGRPTILFEKHIFYRYLPQSKRRAAVKAGLATRSWTGRYDDQKGYDPRWKLFRAALKLDPEAAIKATSWGIGQIMGFNHAQCGFLNVRDFAKAMHRNEFSQMMAVAMFVRNQSALAEAFKFADFQVIARFYNGSGQIDMYAQRMRMAYEQSEMPKKRVPAIKDGLALRRRKSIRLGSNGEAVVRLQTILNKLGYAADPDGDFGRFTEDAVILFQRHNGLKMDGVVGRNTLAALKQAQPLELNTKPLPEIIKTNKPLQASLATTAIGAVAGLVGALPEGKAVNPTETPQHKAFLTNLKTVGETAKMTQQAVQPLGSLATYVKGHAAVSVAAVAIALGLWAFSRSLNAFRNRNWSFS